MAKYFLGLIAVIVISISCSHTNTNIIEGNFEPVKAKDDSTYYVAVQEMPEPLNGISDILKNLVYPQSAKDAGIQGNVYVLAYVNEKGDVEKVKVIKGPGYGLNEAAADAIKKTKFKPGKHKGKTLKVQVSIPIVFKLD